MRPQFILLAVAALAAALLALLVLRSGDPGDVHPDTNPPRAIATESVPIPADPVPIEPARTEVERSTAAIESVTASASAAKVEHDAVLVGRVIDARGAPLPDAHITLNSVGGPWATGREVPKRTIRGYDHEGYEARSGADGRFRIELVLPTSDWISMMVEAGAFHGRDTRDFGPAGGRDRPRIAPGETNLGDIALAACGAVRGNVRGADGTPIGSAQVRIEDRFPGGMVVGTSSNEDGTFELGSIPHGTWTIGAKAKGWLSGRKSGVEVAIDRTIAGFELVLERAPTISGIVVDGANVPLAGVRVWGWPVGSGQGAGARSEADGRFTMFLPQAEPYDLEVTRQPEYEDWGTSRAPSETFEPGTTDVRIVLKRNARVRFRVLDAASDAPIPTFTIMLENVPQNGTSWNRFSMPQPPVSSANGEVELAATIDKQDVGVAAPGYASKLARVAFDADAPGIQTLRLEPESSIVARLVHGGVPVASATVLVEAERLLVDPASDPNDDWAERRTDVDEYAGRRRALTSDASGSLRIGELAPGTYRLRIDAPGVARMERTGIVVAAAAELDLGTIELATASRIAGRIVVPPGKSPIGLELQVGFGFDRETRVTSADGSFTIDGLAAGSYEVVLQALPPLLVEQISRTVELGPGEMKDVLFDLAAAAPCAVEVEVVSSGAPVPGVRVSWAGKSGKHFSFGPDNILSDERGVARGLMPSGEPGAIWIQTTNGRKLHEIKVPSGLQAGGLHRERAVLEVGTLVIELPRDVAVPESGMVSVTLGNVNGSEFQSAQFLRGGHDVPFFAEAGAAWTSHTLELRLIPAGEYVLALDANTMKPMPNGPPEARVFEPLHRVANRPVRIEMGKTTTIDLRPQ